MAISRIDHNNTHGFQVRVVRRGKEHSKMFSDSIHGGKEEANKNAKIYEAHLIETLPPLTHERLKPPSNNTSGILGVTRTYFKHRGIGNGGYYWQTTFICPETGKPKNVKFSVAKYGDSDARERAILCRLAKDNIFTKTGRRKKKYKDLAGKSIIIRKEGAVIRKGAVKDTTANAA